MLKGLQVIALLILVLGSGPFSSLCSADDAIETPSLSYTWGRGLSIPQANLNFGGYLNSTLKKAESQSAHLTLDDLSLFISWSPFDRLHFFSEIELEDFVSTQSIQTLNQSLSLERYYFDYLVTETTRLRIGKYLTPIGIWNVNHAAPLVWTTTRPLITEDQLFSNHATGLMVTHNLTVGSHDMDWSLYVDDSDDLEPRQDHYYDFENALGSRVHFSFTDDLILGASYLTYKNRADFHNERNHLFGADALWSRFGYELQFEFAYRHSSKDHEKGFYLQGVAPIARQLYAVARYEYLDGTHLYDNGHIKSTTHVGIAGLAWRPYAPLVFKAEYRVGHDNDVMAPDGFFASIAMFF